MLYSRSEIRDLCEEYAPEHPNLILSLIWHLSRGDPLCDSPGRFGLLQLSAAQAKAHGVTERELFDARTNVRIGTRVLSELGLLEFLGRTFAYQYHSILALAEFLDSRPRVKS
jgi:soluble lytic murein transglycosylase-like protein